MPQAPYSDSQRYCGGLHKVLPEADPGPVEDFLRPAPIPPGAEPEREGNWSTPAKLDQTYREGIVANFDKMGDLVAEIVNNLDEVADIEGLYALTKFTLAKLSAFGRKEPECQKSN